MGFRNGAYAKVWEIKPVWDTNTKCRISTSRKNKDSGEYMQDFSGYVSFVGTANAKKAACLKEGDRIKLGDVDIISKYDADKKQTYYNFTCFSFETVNNTDTASSTTESNPFTNSFAAVDSGEIDEVDEDNKLPF